MTDQNENTESVADEKPLTNEQIKAVVDKLNHADDAHWNEAGEPDLNVISDKLDRRVTREQVDVATGRLRRKKLQKKATMTIIVDEDVNENELKTWLKSCPFSFEGGQTISWEKV